jgi:hypothetical protein
MAADVEDPLLNSSTVSEPASGSSSVAVERTEEEAEYEELFSRLAHGSVEGEANG